MAAGSAGRGRRWTAACAPPRWRPRSAAGVRQLSQLPQGCDCLAEVASSRTRRQSCASARASSASSLPRSTLLELLAGRALVDHAALVHHVLQAVGHPGVGRQAVAAGAAGLLVVALDVLGQVEVGDEAHVGLVDAHAEGDGGDHHDAVLAQEAVLVALAHARRPARRGTAGPRCPARCSISAVSSTLLARLAVDDAGVARVLVAG